MTQSKYVSTSPAAGTCEPRFFLRPDWVFGLEALQFEAVLKRAVVRFRDVNRVRIEQARSNARPAGMSTTLTVASSLGPEHWPGTSASTSAWPMESRCAASA